MFLEDYEVGQVFEMDPVVVDEKEMIEFAKMYDPRDFHLKQDAAEKTRFGDIFASGFFSLTFCWSRWVKTGIDADGMIAGIGFDNVRWLKPVFADDTLYVKISVEKISPSSNGKTGTVYLRMNVKNQNNEDIIDALALVLVKSKSASE